MRRLLFLVLVALVSAAHCSGMKAKRGVRVRNLKSLVKQQGSAITMLKAELTAYKKQVDSNSKRMDSYTKQVNSYKGRVDAYKKQVDSMVTQLTSVQKKQDAASMPVAFTVRLHPDHDDINSGMALGHHQTLVFDDVITNIGQAYNSRTGIFTAPVTGTYVFFLHAMSPNQKQPLYLAIVKNRKALGLVYSKGHMDRFDQASTQVTTRMAAGDWVWVRQEMGNGVRAGDWTVFTGFLQHTQ